MKLNLKYVCTVCWIEIADQLRDTHFFPRNLKIKNGSMNLNRFVEMDGV